MFEGIRVISFKRVLRCGVFTTLSLIILSGCDSFLEADQASDPNRRNTRFAGTNKALIYSDNPTVLTGTKQFDSLPNIEKKLIPDMITGNNELSSTCSFTQNITSSTQSTKTTFNNCLFVLNDDNGNTESLTKLFDSWNYPIHSDGFYQVNTYYHVKKILSRFFDSLSYSHKKVHFESNMSIPPATKSNMVDTASFWLAKNGGNSTMKVYSKCPLDQFNAFYSPADNSICLGHNIKSPNFFMAQDPTVIYHEIGHALVKTMMNQRNTTSGIDPITFNAYFNSHPFHSDLGIIGYDEAGAINEGIADFFSYYMNARARVGEWGLGKAQGDYRPLKEDDSAHIAEVTSTPSGRLSYPQFVFYNPANPNPTKTGQLEDVHNSGMIITHYLVALTEALIAAKDSNPSACRITQTTPIAKHKEAVDLVFLTLNETLAEVGDLTAKGSDLFNPYSTIDSNQFKIFFSNLNDEESFLWGHVVNPPNFRKFSRIMAKNILHHISANLCSAFTKDDSEKLLDDYGLLLFRSYEDRGNGYDIDGNFQLFYEDFANKQVFAGEMLSPVHPVLIGNTQVNEANRRNSVLVSKDFIKLDDGAIAYVFDGQTEIRNILQGLTFEGQNVSTTPNLAGVEYNNNGVSISPGEVVGIALNLYNSSNSPMGGVQVLANDWDHMKLNKPNDPIYSDGNPANDPPFNFINRFENMQGIDAGTIDGYTAVFSPCRINNFPLASEGGVTDTDDTVPGNCATKSKTNFSTDKTEVVAGEVYPKHELDSPQPICLVQYNDENETKWVSQDFYRKFGMSRLEDRDCLNNPSMSGNDFNPNECLIRFLPGASQAVFSRIDAQRTWPDSVQGGDNSIKLDFTASNITIMEVNKNLSIGTKFSCRFRVRFSNCSDCYDEYSSLNKWNDHPDFEFTGEKPFKVINFQFEVSQ